jgi:ribosomal protein L22
MAQVRTAQKNTAATATKATPSEKKLVFASARFIQMSPQKVRLVADIIRNKQVDFALQQLRKRSRSNRKFL